MYSCRPDHLSTLRIQFSIQGETGNIIYTFKKTDLKKLLYLNSNSGSFDATHGGKILIPTLNHNHISALEHKAIHMYDYLPFVQVDTHLMPKINMSLPSHSLLLIGMIK